MRKIIKWLEDRIECYNYEYRYLNDDKRKKAVDTKRIEASEILKKMRKICSLNSSNINNIQDI